MPHNPPRSAARSPGPCAYCYVGEEDASNTLILRVFPDGMTTDEAAAFVLADLEHPDSELSIINRNVGKVFVASMTPNFRAS